MMRVQLVDGTYELYRQFFGTKSSHAHAATHGVIRSTLALFEQGGTHVGVATDHVIESFRNDLWSGYKTGEGIEPELFAQIHLIEEVLTLMGVKVWAMTELEADDALATGAAIASADSSVNQVQILTPDKDLGQCVQGDRVVQVDRRNSVTINEEGVIAKFGVSPKSIPDWLGLVGDSADGFPGLAGWGAKSAAVVLARYKHLEEIPANPSDWDVQVRGANKLGETLQAEFQSALLFRDLATLRVDKSLLKSVDDLRWQGPSNEFSKWCSSEDMEELADRAQATYERFSRR